MPALSPAPRWQPEARRAAPARAAAAQPLALSPAGERARRRVVRLVLLLLLLAICEGAIRKWIAPQLGTYIFFLRDPVLLLAYWTAMRHGLWPRRELFLKIAFGMTVGGLGLMALQATIGGHSDHRLILGIYGWRAYFLYVPLAFLVGAVFRRDDVLGLMKWTLWLAIPIGILVALQFASPQGAAINVGIAEEQEYQFKGLGLNAERTRPMGPFASGAGQQQFVVTAFVALVAYFMSPRHLPRPSMPTLAITGAGVLTCIGLSGSRGMVLQCAVAIFTALMVGFVGRGGAVKGRAFLWPAVLTVGALVAYPLVFPDGYAAFVDRWQAADRSESQGTLENTGVFLRAIFGLFDFLRVVDDVPVLGVGLGFGGNAVITLGATVDGAKVPYAESDFSRHMVDLGPVFGAGYMLFRLALAASLTAMALRATRLLGDPMPMLLWSYVAYVVVMGQLTGQGTINFYGWLFTGLLIASCKPPAALRRGLARPPVRPARPGRLRPTATKGIP